MKHIGHEYGWDSQDLQRLIDHATMLGTEAERLEHLLSPSYDIHPSHVKSMRNLLHYLAIRRHDIRLHRFTHPSSFSN